MFGITRQAEKAGRSSEPTVADFVAEVDTGNPLVALQELASQLNRARTAKGVTPRLRFEIADVIDHTGRPLYRALAHSYLTEYKQLTKFQEERLFNTVTSYVSELAEAYRHCLAKCEVGAEGSQMLMGLLPVITVRALRATAARLKWSYLRYRRVEARHWGELANLYLLASGAGFGRKPLSLYKGARQDCSAEQEFLQALMLAIASPGSLLPEQVDIAERLIARFAPEFTLSARPAAALTHFIDLRSTTGPQRLPPSREMPETALAFGCGGAAQQLKRLGAGLAEGTIGIGEVGLGRGFEVEVVRATIRHLARYWSAAAPKRREERQRDATRITVMHGFEEVAPNLGGVALSYPFVSEREQWIIENRSGTGFSAMVPSPHGRWVSVGSLVAFREEEDAIWTSGLVRRILRENDDTRYVAVELVARGGAGVTVRPHLGSKNTEEGVLCVLLPGPAEVGEEVRLLLPPGTFSESSPLEMRIYDRRYLLIPIELIESSPDCQVGLYKVLRPAG